MTEVKRTIKLVTHQSIIPNQKPVEEGFPMRQWSIKLFVKGPNGEDLPANIFDKVQYRLHPTFSNPNRTIKKPPFKIDEQGWGEFDMDIILYSADKGGEHHIKHDLNFQEEDYTNEHVITFSNPRPNLQKLLAASGPVPGYNGVPAEENGISNTKRDKRKHDGEERSKKKGKSEKQLDMEKLAEGLQKLDEDSLLLVVQMIHDNKTETTYVKNDIEQGEFHVDLYTLPESLQKDLWKVVQEKGAYWACDPVIIASRRDFDGPSASVRRAPASLNRATPQTIAPTQSENPSTSTNDQHLKHVSQTDLKPETPQGRKVRGVGRASAIKQGSMAPATPVSVPEKRVLRDRKATMYVG